MAANRGRHTADRWDLSASAVGIGAFGLRTVTTLMLAATAMGMLAIAAAIFVLHLGLSPVLTGSMRGTFDPGAAVLTQQIPVDAVKPGDVLQFTPPGESDAFTHRVQTVKHSPTGLVITTKGDANPAPDSWHAQLSGPTARKVVFAVPEVGRLLVALHQRETRALALAFAGLVFSALGFRAVITAGTPRTPPVLAG